MSFQTINPNAPENGAAEIDPTKVEQLMRDIRSRQNLPLGFLGGLAAAIIGAVIWAVITSLTHFQIGFMAVGIGFMVGYAVSFFGKGLSQPFGIVGAVLSLFGCLLGNFLTDVVVVANAESVSFITVLTTLLPNPGIIYEVMKATFSPIDLLFYAIAVYEGYKFSFRRLTGDEIASLQKRPANNQI